MHFLKIYASIGQKKKNLSCVMVDSLTSRPSCLLTGRCSSVDWMLTSHMLVWSTQPVLCFSPSFRLEVLQTGDRILGINGVRMDGVLLQQALKFVQEAGDTIEMEVEFDVTGRSCDCHVRVMWHLWDHVTWFYRWLWNSHVMVMWWSCDIGLVTCDMSNSVYLVLLPQAFVWTESS